MKTIQDVTKRFKTPKLGASVFRPLPRPFEMTPNDYLGYAEKDLNDGDTRAAVTAVSNVRLALESRIDELLINWGYHKFAKKQDYNFDKKLKLLSSLGLMAPLALKQVLNYKHDSEVDYHQVSLDTALAYFTAVSMFVSYTDRILKIANEAEVIRDKADGDFVNVELDSEKHKITLRCFIHDGKPPEQSITESRVQVSLTEEKLDDYNQAIKWWLKAIEG